MTVKKKDGQFYRTRNSNKKYHQLDDIDRIKELTRIDCPADVARSLGVPYNSLRHMLINHLTPEELELVAWKRKPHKNKVITK